MRLTGVDVDRINLPGIIEQQTERVATARTDGENCIAGLDQERLSIRLGIFPAHAKQQLGQFHLSGFL
jgi:hypothetical protein